MSHPTASYLLKGHITAETPINVSYMGLDKKLPRTPHGQVFLNSGTLRGPLRKAMLEVVLRDIATEKGLTLNEMYMLGQGVDITRGVNNEATGKAYNPLAEKQLRDKNPVLSLMGRWKLAGRLEVQPMLTPESNVITAGQGVRHDQFERDPALVEWLNEDERQQLLETLESSFNSMGDLDEIRAEIKSKGKEAREAADDKELQKSIYQEIDALKEREKGVKEARKGAQESIKHPIDGYESIAPGAELTCNMRITSGTPVHLGLLLRALGVFSEDARLGGHAAGGFGNISARWTVYRRDANAMQAVEIGELRLDDLGVHITGDELHASLDALQAAIPEMDVTAILLADAEPKKG